MVGIGDTDEQIQAADRAVRKQIAFYASTPAYKSVLDTHDRADLQPVLQGLSREGKWDDMTSHIDDDLAAEFSCVGRPDEVAKLVLERWSGVVHRIGINTPGQSPDRDQMRDLITQLHAAERL
jgi:alkanesulfonate monooxygenase SsuD/methylene tetrahydromethanopterin reductase-like flavin-dependent oxidoreductase (luciferase family)